MALNGTLKDMGITDLVQFPHSGRRTGELVIETGKEQAKLHYDQGQLVHATCGDVQGLLVLVEVLDWSDGLFQFRNENAWKGPITIELELHRALMQALKLRDEQRHRRAQEPSNTGLSVVQEQDLWTALADIHHQIASSASSNGQLSEHSQSKLEGFVGRYPLCLHACLISSQGRLLGEYSQRSRPPQSIAEVRAAAYVLVQGFPRPGLRKVLIEDDLGNTAVEVLPNGELIIVVANGKGIVSMMASKLVKWLREA